MADKIQWRRDQAADWALNNPTLSDGEVGWERDTNTFKIGDGLTPWNSLAYFTSGSTPSAIAGQALGGHRVVVQTNGLLYYASALNILHINRIMGLTTSAVTAGAVAEYVYEGLVTESSWSWNLVNPIYLADNGLLTQSPVNTTGFTQIIGTPVSATSMYVSIKTPITLS